MHVYCVVHVDLHVLFTTLRTPDYVVQCYFSNLYYFLNTISNLNHPLPVNYKSEGAGPQRKDQIKNGSSLKSLQLQFQTSRVTFENSKCFVPVFLDAVAFGSRNQLSI